jgi:uncharacterized protein
MPTKILLTEKVSFKNAILIVGLPGVGLVGKLSVDYLLKELKPKKIGEILSDSFPPSVHTKNSQIHLIKDELFHIKKGKNDFLFLAGPVQPTLDFKSGSPHEHYEFSETLINYFKSIGVSEIITLAGINVGEKRINKKPGVIVAGTEEKVIKDWEKVGAKRDKKEGLISGVAGLLLGLGKLRNIKGACLMGETTAQLIYGDQGSAKSVLELLKKKYKFKVNMKSIAKDTQQIEKAFKELTQQLESVEEESGEAPTYVR